MTSESKAISLSAAVGGALASVLVLVGAPSCASRDIEDGSDDVSTVEDALATQVSGVTFETQLKSRFVGAQDNGGGAVIATATVAQAWETFTLIDKNGGSLVSGDEVFIKTGGGQYFQALDGGGSTLNAASYNQLGWETFRIVKVNGSGVIHSGDVIGLQAVTKGTWVSAQNGGGGPVFAYGSALGDWEKLVINLGSTTPSGWKLVWSDEFDGSSIDASKWSYEVQSPGWVNHELQAYTDHRAANARVENGHLVIEGRHDWYNGAEYTSARLKTQGKASWKYGRVEARIQLPGGWGTWPAFWMMPDDQSRGWPACGEIDIMEEVGYDQDSIHATTHSKTYNWKGTQQRTAATNVGGVTTGYHVYALEWFPDHMDMFVDGQKYFTSPNDNTGDDAWPFDKNFHIILNLAIGGDWGGAQGVDPNIWPRQMLVDYVRVYQR
ncbi:MAG: glycoside hydrolase family 16 protein [Minicystis sp.]